jgi:glycosyltransferase involved in cell wall biosynthesis
MSSPRVLVVHRDYKLRGGEETFLETALLPALEELGIDFSLLRFPALFSGKSKLLDFVEFFFMVLGLERLRPSYFTAKRLTKDAAYTHCIFNNFIPTVSLAMPALLKSRGATTYWWTHNQRISCSNGLKFNGKGPCNLCFERGSRWAAIQNCHSNRIQSVLYALIYRGRRVLRRLGPSIDCFVGGSNYSLRGVTAPLDSIGGFKPNTALIRSMPPGLRTATKVPLLNPRIARFIETLPKPFFLFVGRVSREKGADIFVELAQRYPKFGFVLGGSGPLLESLRATASSNLVLTGHLEGDEKLWLFENCEALVICSRVPENGPMILFESQPYGTPVVYVKGGGAEELVKWLGRDGCSVEDFRGQRFSKSRGLQTPADSFSEQLKELIAKDLCAE